MVSPLLLHAGAGSTWQAMVSVVALGLALVVVLAAFDRVELSAPGDLILPLAGVAILSSLAPLGDRWLSDWIGWAFPVGVVSLVALLLTALTSLDLSARGVLLYVTVGSALVGGLVLYQPLTVAWHPAPEYLPDPGDARVAIVSPDDGARLDAGPTTFEVEVENGSVGPGDVPLEDLGDDPTEAGTLEVTVDSQRVPVPPEQTCTRQDPCSRVDLPLDLPEGEGIAVRVELLRGDGMPFSPAVSDRIELTVR